MITTTCLADDELIGYTSATLDRISRDRIEAHLDMCSRCLALVGGLARGSRAGAVPWTGQAPFRLLADGAVVAKRYLIRRALGAGAMGEVYEAEDQLLGKTIALKTLNAVVAADPGALARLRREVALAHRVTHPNVCRIYDIGVESGSAPERTEEPLRFLTMEYLEGRTLSAFLRDHGPLRVARAFPILRQLAAALAAAHEVGVIHRDLKGDNVMVARDPGGRVRVVVTDFGLAGPMLPADVLVSDERWPYSSVRAHVAPEQLAGKPANPATDVYAFGLLAYEILTGNPPSPDDLRADSLLTKLHLRSGSGRVGASRRWQRFLRHTLHPDARLRLPDGAALESALLALGASTRSTSRRWALGGALSFSIAAAGVLVFGSGEGRPPPAPAIRPVVVQMSRDAKADRLLAAPIMGPSTPSPSIAPRVRLRQPKRVLVRAPIAATQVPTAPVERPAAEPDEIIRVLRPSAPTVAADDELADPFAARRGAVPIGDR